MNILYIANARIPTEKAHGLQIMKTCEALADLGHAVELIVPRRKNKIAEDPFVYYNVRPVFKIHYTFSVDVPLGNKIAFLLRYVSFSVSIMFSHRLSSVDIIYGRDELTLLAASLVTRTPVVWESHTGGWNLAAQLLLKKHSILVVISKGLEDFYKRKGILQDRIVVSPDAVDLHDFASPESKETARKRLGLSPDKKIALYIGRLDAWKGADTLGRASELLSDDIQVVMIGGEVDQVIAMQRKYPKVTFLGYHPYRELAHNQAAADILVLPNSNMTEVSSHFTSPLKLFTYMAANRPIIASDLPSIREVLDEGTAYFVAPDDPTALAKGISDALEDTQSFTRAEKAKRKVHQYTWSARATGLVSAIRDKIKI